MVIDDLKILIDAVAGMEGTVIYVLIGYIIYQLAIFAGTTGAIVAILRLFILKVHNVLITKKNETIVNEIKLDGHICTTDDNVAKIHQAFSLIKKRNGIYGSTLYSPDCTFLLNAVEEKIENDKKKEKES